MAIRLCTIWRVGSCGTMSVREKAQAIQVVFEAWVGEDIILNACNTGTASVLAISTRGQIVRCEGAGFGAVVVMNKTELYA